MCEFSKMSLLFTDHIFDSKDRETAEGSFEIVGSGFSALDIIPAYAQTQTQTQDQTQDQD
jgi:hypothetical protein